MKKLRVLDLFSGIGGFSLGLERTGGFETVAFCEIEEFPRRVLEKHWPEVPCHDDVRTLNVEPGIADVVCGGFPCQDISNAGERAGISGERSGLYREMVRTIRVVRPRYAVMENVAALLHRGLGEVVGDLAEIGYDAEWHCLPAGHFGASHERDRIWIIANSQEARCPHIEGWTGPAEQVRGQIITSDDVGRRPRQRSAEPALVRVVHGVSADVDAVAALGNSIHPSVAEIIGQAILKAEGLTP